MGRKPNQPRKVCEKCHVRTLHPVYDRHHKWCKRCRAEALIRISELSPDERRIRRIKPEGDAFLAHLSLLRVIITGEPGLVVYKTGKKIRFDYTSTQKKERKKLLEAGRLLPMPDLIK